MWNPFKKEAPAPAGEQLYAPTSGRLLTMEEVPDPVFAGKSMGDGFAVEPTDGTFRSPVAGKVILLAPTLHAFGIESDGGAQVLVHIGIDTVTLKGEGFRALAAVGDRVEVGTPVIECDLATVSAKVPSMVSPVIVTNGREVAMGEVAWDARGGEPVVALTRR